MAIFQGQVHTKCLFVQTRASETLMGDDFASDACKERLSIHSLSQTYAAFHLKQHKCYLREKKTQHKQIEGTQVQVQGRARVELDMLDTPAI